MWFESEESHTKPHKGLGEDLPSKLQALTHHSCQEDLHEAQTDPQRAIFEGDNNCQRQTSKLERREGGQGVCPIGEEDG